MALRRWRTLTRSVRSTNPWWSYRLNTFHMPNGSEGEYHFVHTNGSSLIVPLTPDGKIILVNQYRYLAERESIEFPCGSVKDGSTYEDTARHELREETGYEAETLTPVGKFNPYNGVTDEFCTVFVGRGLRHIGARPDPTEEFEVLAWPASDIERHIADGTIWDGMTIAAWCIVRGKQIIE